MPCATCSADCESSRCKECGTKDVRICRALKNSNEVFQEDWKDALKSKMIIKRDFYELAQDKQGTDLLKLMENTLIQKLTCSNEAELVGTGEWFSEVELRKQLKDEPARCEAILKNADRWYDSNGEIELIQLMRYSTKNTTRTKREIEESWASTCHDRVKRVKAPKAAIEGNVDNTELGEPQGDAAGGKRKAGGEKPLTPTQIAWIEKHVGPVAAVDTLKETLAEFKVEANQIWAQFIPPVVVIRAAAAITKFEQQKEVLQMTKEKGTHSDFKALQATMKGNTQWEEAWGLLSTEDQDKLLAAENE